MTTQEVVIDLTGGLLLTLWFDDALSTEEKSALVDKKIDEIESFGIITRREPVMTGDTWVAQVFYYIKRPRE